MAPSNESLSSSDDARVRYLFDMFSLSRSGSLHHRFTSLCAHVWVFARVLLSVRAAEIKADLFTFSVGARLCECMCQFLVCKWL